MMDGTAEAEVETPSAAFFSADLPPDELGRILAKIEENVAFRAELWQSGDGQAEISAMTGNPRRLASAPSGQIDGSLQGLNAVAARAPLYWTSGAGVRPLVKRVLNLPIRIFGRPQRAFNLEVTRALWEMGVSLREQAGLVSDLAHELQTVRDELRGQDRETVNWLTSVAERQEAVERRLESVGQQQSDTSRAIKAMAATMLEQPGTALRKSEVRDYKELKGWYDEYFGEHKTWYTSPAYAAEIWRLMAEHWANDSAKDRLLDVACGGGHFLERMRSEFRELHGCDLSEAAVSDAKERLGDTARIQVANAEELPYSDNYFDAVTCLGSLEHFLDTERALREMIRVGKETALYGILVPVTVDWIMHDVQPTEVVMSRAGWSALLNRCGLTVLSETLTDTNDDLKPHSPGHVCLVAQAKSAETAAAG